MKNVKKNIDLFKLRKLYTSIYPPSTIFNTWLYFLPNELNIRWLIYLKNGLPPTQLFAWARPRLKYEILYLRCTRLRSRIKLLIPESMRLTWCSFHNISVLFGRCSRVCWCNSTKGPDVAGPLPFCTRLDVALKRCSAGHTVEPVEMRLRTWRQTHTG